MDPQSASTHAGALVSTVTLSGNTARRVRRLRPIAPPRPAGGLMPGVRLDRYLILDHLGGGGMGQVYRAHDGELNRIVALKLLPPPLCHNPVHADRFRAEAQAQACVHSPHVITLYSLLELPAGAVLVLEHVQGETLEARLRRQGPLDVDQAIEVFAQALTGVEHIHEAGVIHRDLKPSNIVLNDHGPVKIMDFGVARLADRDVFQRGSVVGTLLYISPEQINGRALDRRTDIYTMGVSLYEAVTGRLPFERRSDYALMHAHVQETPPSPRSLQRHLPPGLERVILRAMEKDPGRRFQTAVEFRQALTKLGTAASIRPRHTLGPTPTPQPQPARSRFVVGIAVDGLLLAMVGLLLYSLGLYPTGPTTTVAAPATTARTSARPAPTPLAAVRQPAPKPIAKTPHPAERPKPKGLDALREAWGQ